MQTLELGYHLCTDEDLLRSVAQEGRSIRAREEGARRSTSEPYVSSCYQRTPHLSHRCAHQSSFHVIRYPIRTATPHRAENAWLDSHPTDALLRKLNFAAQVPLPSAVRAPQRFHLDLQSFRPQVHPNFPRLYLAEGRACPTKGGSDSRKGQRWQEGQGSQDPCASGGDVEKTRRMRLLEAEGDLLSEQSAC
jgi:hypothetical protein